MLLLGLRGAASPPLFVRVLEKIFVTPAVSKTKIPPSPLLLTILLLIVSPAPAFSTSIPSSLLVVRDKNS